MSYLQFFINFALTGIGAAGWFVAADWLDKRHPEIRRALRQVVDFVREAYTK